MRTARRCVLAAIVVVAAFAAGTASAAAPQNTSNPSIEGNPVVGRVLTANPGMWNGSPARFDYTWQRCDAAGANCGNIPGAARQHYSVAAADAGHRLIVLVTAINSDGRSTVNSHPTAVVATTGTAQNTSRPTISGTAKVGEELRADRGAWNSAASSFSYQWQRCDANGNACQNLDATGRTYGVRAADAGRTLRVAVTGYGSSGGSTVVSDRTAVVQGLAAPAPVVITNPCSKLAASAASQAVAATDLSLPNRLLISNVEFAPTVLRSRSTFTARFRVMDSCGRPVVGALVYATGVPFGKVQNAPEVATDGQGWATIQLTPTARLALAPHTALQLFVRARKSGENVLGGISTRRLVQVGIGR